jgi:hypothetical protein
LGDATVSPDNSWTYTASSSVGASGSSHALTAKIYTGATTNILASTSNSVYFKISPIVLDLNQDGQISYTHQLMDVTGQGVVSNVTWAAPTDGVLFWNKYGNGEVHDKSQYAFGDPSKGITDLQGLARDFDTNHDGVFNAADDKYSEFMVWQDLNGDGLSQAGETQTLADWGITSLTLSSDGVKNLSFAGVEESGRTNATLSNGQSMVVADATFSYTKATVLQGVEASADTFHIDQSLTQIKGFNLGDGDVIDLSGLLGQLHTQGGNSANYVQTIQRGNDTVIQVDATGQHDFAHATHQVVLTQQSLSFDQLMNQSHFVI